MFWGKGGEGTFGGELEDLVFRDWEGGFSPILGDVVLRY